MECKYISTCPLADKSNALCNRNIGETINNGKPSTCYEVMKRWVETSPDFKEKFGSFLDFYRVYVSSKNRQSGPSEI